jgi:Protein of unknown function (DUF2281)
MMSLELIKTLGTLPETLQQEVLHYAEFLITKYKQVGSEETLPVKHRKAGTMEGLIIMSDDFDAPLEDLKDYM